MTEQLAIAETLQRNVPFTIHWAADDKSEETLKLSREELETLAEYCGLTGWQRICLVGHKRDALRRQNMPHGSEDVLRALKDVRWSPDNEMSNHVVQKSLTIWNKIAENKDIERAINTAHQIWGRKSLFEDWTKTGPEWSSLERGKS